MSFNGFDDIPGVLFGFGDKHAPIPPFALPYWPDRPVKKQVHGTRVEKVVRTGQDVGEADGWLTREAGVPLSIYTADCLPVLLARQDGNAIAAIHAGWRGALGGIAATLAATMVETGERPEEWYALLGPCAQACCYEVSEEMITSFVSQLDMPRDEISPNGRMLALSHVMQTQLQRCGFQVRSAHEDCTICGMQADERGQRVPRYHSYRREKGAGRDPRRDQQHAVIMRKP